MASYARFNIDISRGSPFEALYRFVQRPVSDDIAMDITGYEFQGQIRSEVDGRLIAQLRITIFGDPTDGTILVEVPETAAFPVREPLVWDAMWRCPGDAPEVVLKGGVTVDKGVTQWQ
jgi:hypothetical protein